MTLISVLASDRLAAQEAIGAVSRLQGEASRTRGNTTRPLSLNASLILNETVSTGAAARQPRAGFAQSRPPDRLAAREDGSLSTRIAVVARSIG